jgi:hypothetical protein
MKKAKVNELEKFTKQQLFDELIHRLIPEGHEINCMFIDYVGGWQSKEKYGYAVLSDGKSNIVTTSYSVKDILEKDSFSDFEKTMFNLK